MAGQHGDEESDTAMPRRILLKAMKQESDLCPTQEIGSRDLFRDVVVPLR